MIIGYARVSSVGQSLEEQIEILTEKGCDYIYAEKMSGKSVEGRAEFQAMMESVCDGDTLIVTKLDRLARNTQEGLECIATLMEMGVAIEILNMGRIDNSAVGKLAYTMLLAFAEYERNMIRERCQSGYDRARANGVVVGRPKKIDEVARLEGESIAECCKRLGISRASYYRLATDR